MSIQPVKQVVPIICPELFYVDRFGLSNAYQQCNCSVYKDQNDYIILVRMVNYDKYANASYVVGGHTSDSRYYQLRGKDLNNLTATLLKVDWNNLPRNVVYNTGIDDVRFVNANTLMIICCECNLGRPCVFLASLENDVVKVETKLSPNHIEKNWMPFNDHQVIYMVSPFVVKSIKEDDREIIPIDPFILYTLEGYHGSTNGITYKDGYLFLVHKNIMTHQSKTIHRWMYYHPINRVVKVSQPFTFFQYTFLEFPFSLVDEGDETIMVSLGVNEKKSYLLRIATTDIVINGL